MNDVKTSSGSARRAWHRLLDGDRSWGSIDVRSDRFGVTRHRLVVFPPGISDVDRRWVRAARGWPLWGALVWIVAEIWLSHVTGPWKALALSIAIYLGLGLITVVMAGAVRRQVHTMVAMVMVGYRDPGSIANRDRLIELAARLMAADDDRAGGRISVAEHESVWWSVYDETTADRTTGWRVV